MDPLIALSVAGTIIQFVDFGIKILKHGSTLYHSSTGLLPVHEEIELVATDLAELTARLSRSLRIGRKGGVETRLVEEEKALEELYASCSKVARELFEKLARLRVEGKGAVVGKPFASCQGGLE
jgi:hypothetical protein